MSEQRNRLSRRQFIGAAAGAAASVNLLANLPASVAEAAQGRKGDLDRIEHVVILMQENRSFDHYYGTMRGVRGFGDRAANRIHTGNDIFHQPDPLRSDGGFLPPWRIDTSKVDGQDLGGTPHDWNSTHAQWDNGLWDMWPPFKTELSMSYYGTPDLPFQRALGQAFTICDNYFCSVLGPTTPNRCYLWTGTIDPFGQNGGPCSANPDDYVPVFTWTTYPERLQKAGITWQVYANDEVGDGDGADGYVGDFGDNPLWLFQAYHDSLASSDPKKRELAMRGGLHDGWKLNSGLGKDTTHVLAQFIDACNRGTLPAVSWVVAPYLYSEHPLGRPVDGAAYAQTMLNAIFSNHSLAQSTVVFLNYDENDGFFDHLVPPSAPQGTTDEYLPPFQPSFSGRVPASHDPNVPMVPIGLGPRVPMTVVSPWSRGGWVNSQVFDHTSVLRFLELWTGVHEPNISAWRRAICGDLTSCFDFADPKFTIPSLPDTGALRAQADQIEHTLPAASPPPPGQQTMPVQDAGALPARALPYQPLADCEVNGGQLVAHLSNKGDAALQLTVYAHHAIATDVGQRFDLAPGGSANAKVVPEAITQSYDVEIHGPNGFLRRAMGSLISPENGVEAELAITGGNNNPRLKLTLRNNSGAAQTLHVSGLHNTPHTFQLGRHDSQNVDLDPIARNHGWYDLTVSVQGHPQYARRFAGHLENGDPSRSGPS